MTKSELIQKVSEDVTCSKQDIAEVIDACIKEITYGLLNGHKVVLNNFGTFSTRTTAARPVYNFQTEEVVEMKGRLIPVFKMSKNYIKEFSKMKK